MEKVASDKYLGDIISDTGSNTLEIKDRVGKGVGKINEIVSILETISFGHQYFRIVVLLSILTNAEIWYGLKSYEISELEDLDRRLLGRAFKCPITTPKEAYFLELGIKYFHFLINSDPQGMLFHFFHTMYENPSKDD